MKFNKTLICLIICLALVSQIDARKQKATQKKAKTLDYEVVWSAGTEVKVEVIGVSNYEFKAKIKDIIDDQKQPIGFEFDAFEQLTENDKSGFVAFGYDLTNIKNQDTKKQMIDFRQVTNCLFTDNAKEYFGKWRLEFDLNFNEEYGIKQQTDKNFGNALRVKMYLTKAGSKEANQVKASLNKNCLIRNNQITGLKKAAIDAGNKYHSLWFEYNNRQQSLDDQAKLVTDAKKVVEQVRVEEVAKSQAFAAQVALNEKQLQESLALLNSAAVGKQSNEQETEAISENLNTIRTNLLNLGTSQSIVKANIEKSKSQLNSAIKLQKESEAKQASLEQKQQELAKKSEADKLEYDRLLKEIQDRQKKMQEEYALQKQKQTEQAKTLTTQTNQVAQDLTAQTKSIEGIKQAIQAQLNQVKSIDDQVESTKSAIEKLQEQINKKRSISAQLNAQIKQQQTEVAAREQRAKQIKEDSTKQLNLLKQKEIDQINLIANIDADMKKKLMVTADEAHATITKAEVDFTNSLQNIVKAASKAGHRTERAAKVVLQKGHVSEISAVVSSTEVQIKASQMRQARRQKEINRLAKLRNKQIKLVRMQRNQLKNKLRHRLSRNKY